MPYSVSVSILMGVCLFILFSFIYFSFSFFFITANATKAIVSCVFSCWGGSVYSAAMVPVACNFHVPFNYCDIIFSPFGQKYPFLELSEFLYLGQLSQPRLRKLSKSVNHCYTSKANKSSCYHISDHSK